MRFLVRLLPAVLLVAAAPALGQMLLPDDPPVIPPPAAPTDTWSGLYVGGNLGYGTSRSNATLSPSGCFTSGTCGVPANNASRTFSASLSGSGVAAGGQVGYNWRLSPAFLLGAEADFDYDGAGSSYTATTALPAPLQGNNTRSISQSPDFLGTVRGRAGFLPSERWLLYATGGIAFGETKSATTTTESFLGDSYAGNSSGITVGWTDSSGGTHHATVQLTSGPPQ